MRVAYVSGPIAGYPELNEPLFRAAARRLVGTRVSPQRKYDKVVVPHDIDPHQHEGPCPASYVQNGDHTAACYLRTDLIEMLRSADDVWMLPGWEASVGARLEMQVAAACGLGVKFFHRNDLGCAHNGYGWGKCDDSECWNYRKPQAEVAAAVRRVGEPMAVNEADTLGEDQLVGCAHRKRPGTNHCDNFFCPNHDGRPRA